MRKVLRLAQREYLAAVRTKGFIIGLLLAPILMSGGLIAMVLLKDHVDTTDKRVAVLDRTGTIAPALIEAAEKRNAQEVHDEATGKKVKPAYLIEVVEPRAADPQAQRLELSERVRSGQLHAFLDIGAEVYHPVKDSPASRVDYYAKNPAMDDLRRWIAGPLNERLRQRRLADAGITPEQVKGVFDYLPVGSMGLVAQDAKTGEVIAGRRRHEAEAVVAPMLSQILMFLLFMMGAAPLLQAVMEEKSQRIAEVLLGSASPFQIMLGKLMGGVAVSFTASAVYVFGAIFALSSLALGQYIPYRILPWFFAFLLLAVLMYGSIMAALGSACSDSKDAQNLQLPAMMPVIIPMFLLGPLLKEPHSALATGLSLFPPFTPMMMLLRQSTPEGVPWWQPTLGLVGVFLFTIAAVWLSGRVFRVGILMQGKLPKFSELLRWAIRG